MKEVKVHCIAAAVERLVVIKGRKMQARQGTGRLTLGWFFLRGVECKLEQLIHKEYEAAQDWKRCSVTQGEAVLFDWYKTALPGTGQGEIKVYNFGSWVAELLAAAAELDVELAVVIEASSRPLMVGAFSELTGSVVNRSSGPARKVTLGLSGEFAIDPQRLDLAREVAPGQTVSWRVRMAPQASGSVPLRWELSFEDVHGVARKVLGELTIAVERPPMSTSSATYFQAPVTVHGDLLQPGAVKQGEGVIVQKPNSSPPGTRD